MVVGEAAVVVVGEAAVVVVGEAAVVVVGDAVVVVGEAAVVVVGDAVVVVVGEHVVVVVGSVQRPPGHASQVLNQELTQACPPRGGCARHARVFRLIWHLVVPSAVVRQHVT